MQFRVWIWVKGVCALLLEDSLLFKPSFCLLAFHVWIVDLDLTTCFALNVASLHNL